jgi:3-oxoacyl-[acyl-carrier protein] reductase
MDLGLRGHAAFVAASSRGMGLAIARQFAAEGADVAMCARDEPALRTAATSLLHYGTRVLAFPADVTDAAQVSAAVDGAASQLGRLDALVVNAGGPPPGTFETLDDDAWQAAYELTLMSAVRLVRAALPHLRRSDAASIAFVSSFSVRQPIMGLTLSNAVRGGVAGLAKSLAFELAPGIRVNTLLPGNVATDRAISLAATRGGGTRSAEAVMAETARAIPLGRYGDPDEFARVAVFLSSPAASYVTGTTVPVDGGIIQANV